MWHVTCDMWHVTHDIRHIVYNEHALKIAAQSKLLDSVIVSFHKCTPNEEADQDILGWRGDRAHSITKETVFNTECIVHCSWLLETIGQCIDYPLVKQFI